MVAATVRYGRDDTPSHGFAVAETPAADRVLLRIDQPTLLSEMESNEVVGRAGTADGTQLVDLAAG